VVSDAVISNTVFLLNICSIGAICSNLLLNLSLQRMSVV